MYPVGTSSSSITLTTALAASKHLGPTLASSTTEQPLISHFAEKDLILRLDSSLEGFLESKGEHDETRVRHVATETSAQARYNSRLYSQRKQFTSKLGGCIWKGQ